MRMIGRWWPRAAVFVDHLYCRPGLLILLIPIRVHASTRFALKPGTHSVTAHAEFLKLSEGNAGQCFLINRRRARWLWAVG
jgi:hypothetical protein